MSRVASELKPLTEHYTEFLKDFSFGYHALELILMHLLDAMFSIRELEIDGDIGIVLKSKNRIRVESFIGHDRKCGFTFSLYAMIWPWV